MNDFRWLTVEDDSRDVPAWMRSAALADDGTVFVPASIGGETDVMLSAGFDSIPIVRHGGHVFVPAPWLRQEYPHTGALVARIENAVREHFA